MIKRSTVMIVEYEEQSRAFLQGLFEHEYNVIEAENSEQAMFLLRQYSDNISIIILDSEIRPKSGRNFLEEIRRLDDKISVIVITSGEPESIAEAFRLGATEIINKPFEQSVVKKRVENIMELRQNKKELKEIIQERSSGLRELNSSVIDRYAFLCN